MKLRPGLAHSHGPQLLSQGLLGAAAVPAALAVLLLALLLGVAGALASFAPEAARRRALQLLHLTTLLSYFVQSSVALPSSYGLATLLGYGASTSGFIIGSAFVANFLGASLQVKLLTKPWIQQRSRWAIVLSAFGCVLLNLLFVASVCSTWRNELRLAAIIAARVGMGMP